jgi:hypothetical protein
MGFLSQLITPGLARAALWAYMPAFGGEDPLGDAPGWENWHHEGLTRQAADAAGWTKPAQNALAFHADYLDSYLYNPLWWFDPNNGGGPDRLVLSMSSREDLVKIHFDDLVHPDSVRSTWRRYLSGTAAGLIWLGGAASGTIEQRVAMAHNLIGSSLHAIQDFYTHANWIDDDDLRTKTWFETDPELRECLSLWTGTYELPEYFGVKPHGAFVYACTVINRFGSEGRQLLDAVCHAASPLANSSLCGWFRECVDAENLQPPTVELPVDVPVVDETITLPPNVLFVTPGINVDNRWSAETGVKVRGINPPVTGRAAFEAAYELAYRSSCQWLHILDDAMTAARAPLPAFWESVRTSGVADADYKTPRAPWEDYGQLPYRFISAGPYPPTDAAADVDDWYLRLLIRTSGDTFSGTDADIVPWINGKECPPLDHGIQPSPPPLGQPAVRTLDQTLLGHNDFEAGDVAAYMIGPIDEMPRTVALVNNAPDAGGVIQAAVNEIGRGLTNLWNSFVGLWGYHADYVGEDHWVFDAATLASVGAGSRRYFYLECDGRSEGNFVISGFVEGTSVTGRFPSGVPFRRFTVQFLDLICVKESEWDRFTWSDEPFVLGLVIPHGGIQPMQSWRTGPYANVNSGDTNPIGRTFTVDVPQRYGFISVACAVYESDDETPNDRDLLLARFADNTRAAIAQPEKSFVEALGESIASAWRVASVEAVAFRRSPTVDVRAYAPRTFDQWVDGGQRVEWTLAQTEKWEADVPDTISCEHGACAKEVVLPGLKPKIETLDFGPVPGTRIDVGTDPGREVGVDLAQLEPGYVWEVPDHPRELVVDEPRDPPRPRDDCADEEPSTDAEQQGRP